MRMGREVSRHEEKQNEIEGYLGEYFQGTVSRKPPGPVFLPELCKQYGRETVDRQNSPYIQDINGRMPRYCAELTRKQDDQQ